MVTVVFDMQLFASVTTTVYVPADKPFAVAAVPPLGDQLYTNGAAPPVVLTTALPGVIQVALVDDCMVAVTPPVLFTSAVEDTVQSIASVTSTVYVPAPSPVIVADVLPPGVQVYVNAPVPPLAITEAVPSVAPQAALVAATETLILGGSVIVMEDEIVQPAASVTVTVYVPGLNVLVVVAAVPPEAAQM